eukprot:3280885-Rhodomonas_salina.2
MLIGSGDAAIEPEVTLEPGVTPIIPDQEDQEDGAYEEGETEPAEDESGVDEVTVDQANAAATGLTAGVAAAVGLSVGASIGGAVGGSTGGASGGGAVNMIHQAGCSLLLNSSRVCCVLQLTSFPLCHNRPNFSQ